MLPSSDVQSVTGFDEDQKLPPTTLTTTTTTLSDKMISQETTDAAAIKRGDPSNMANAQLDSIKGRSRR